MCHFGLDLSLPVHPDPWVPSTAPWTPPVTTRDDGVLDEFQGGGLWQRNP